MGIMGNWHVRFLQEDYAVYVACLPNKPHAAG